jgi:hypothetical protein
MFKKFVLSAAALVCCATASQAVVLFSDDFNANAVGVSKTPIGWTVTAGSVDVVKAYPTSGKQIDLDGLSTTPAVIKTRAAFNFARGNAYKISFDYGKKTNTFEMLTFGVGSFGSGVISFGASLPLMVHTSFTFLATSNFSSKLFFSGFVGTSNGLVIDNVLLETVTPVPVPPAMFLFGMGLCGLGGLARTRKI